MRITKVKIISAVVILCVLLIAFLWGGKVSRVSQISDPPFPTEAEEKSEAEEFEPAAQPEKENSVLTSEIPKNKSEPIPEQNTTATDIILKDESISWDASEDGDEEEQELFCTLSVSCSAALGHLDKLAPSNAKLIPKDGIIFPAQQVTFFEDETVFQVLQREMKKNKIHMEFVNTPIYHSVYIEGIHNLYEGDCGELSGWIYRVNGVLPGYSCSQYTLAAGDVVEILYTCDSGRDIGGGGEGSGSEG